MGFLGDFGGGAKIFGGNPPRNAMTSFGEKNYGDTVNSLVCTRGKEITKKHKKRNVYTVMYAIDPVCG